MQSTIHNALNRWHDCHAKKEQTHSGEGAAFEVSEQENAMTENHVPLMSSHEEGKKERKRQAESRV
jgi:hypothetical protein